MSNFSRNMFRVLKYGVSLSGRLAETQKVSRPFMSEAFQCKDAWNKRLNNNIFRKVKLNDMFMELDNKFNQTGKVSAIDIDIFTNLINDNIYVEELEALIHRFRLTTEAGNILDSTHHAFIRAFMSCGSSNDLIRILNDRLNYGIFPDDFCNILMMDHFIKENNITNAAKVATFEMLQEGFSNDLVKYFSLYSCHRYLFEPGEWSAIQEVKKVESEEDDDDDEEVQRIRVDYLRNPYFDEHFDLTDSNSLLGKTFKIIGERDNDSASNSYHLLGLTMCKKWQDAINFSNNLIAKTEKINSGCINEIEKFLTSLPQGQSDEKNDEVQEQINQIKNNLVKLKNNDLIVDKELLKDTEEKLNFVIKDQEEKVINNQCKVYEEWESKREQLLEKELEEMKRLERIENLKLKKEELAKKEEELFFFDFEDKLDLEIENKRIEKSKYKTNAVVKQSDLEDYTPPEIVKRRVQ